MLFFARVWLRKKREGDDEPAGELDDDLAATVVIYLLELADVALALHELEEPDDDLRRRAQDDLALALLVGVVDALESIAQNTGANHLVF